MAVSYAFVDKYSVSLKFDSVSGNVYANGDLLGKMGKDGLILNVENATTIELATTANRKWSVSHKLEQDLMRQEKQAALRDRAQNDLAALRSKQSKSTQSKPKTEAKPKTQSKPKTEAKPKTEVKPETNGHATKLELVSAK